MPSRQHVCWPPSFCAPLSEDSPFVRPSQKTFSIDQSINQSLSKPNPLPLLALLS
uniref:Uncharacterized protein n=1 Tax=Picea glauca TaxID=3330 RepID=A0A117NJ24_PICGL|nr:hypothetical protein ABT39_MTgene733 [Picea glauca]